MVVDVRFLLGMYKDFLGKRRCRRRYDRTVHASGCPAARQAPKETGVGMQVTYMHSKMKGACAMSVGLVVSLQRRSLNEDALANMTAW